MESFLQEFTNELFHSAMILVGTFISLGGAVAWFWSIG